MRIRFVWDEVKLKGVFQQHTFNSPAAHDHLIHETISKLDQNKAP